MKVHELALLWTPKPVEVGRPRTVAEALEWMGRPMRERTMWLHPQQMADIRASLDWPQRLTRQGRNDEGRPWP